MQNLGRILLLFLATTTAFAQTSAQTQTPAPPDVNCDPKAALDQFCKDPVAYVCNSEIEQTPAEKDYELKSMGALDLLARDLGYEPGVLNLFNLADVLTKNYRLDQLVSILTKNSKRLMNIANATAYEQTGRVPRVEPVMRKAFADAKEMVRAVVKKNFKGASLIRANAKLDKVEFFTPYDFEPTPDRIYDPLTGTYTLQPNTAKTSNPNAEELLPGYVYNCAREPLTAAANAFQVSKDRGIAICPAFFVQLILRPDSPDVLAGITFVLAHELGHTVYDARNHAATIGCIQDLFPHLYQNEPNPEYLPYIPNEYIADLYGIKALLTKLQAINHFSPGETTMARLQAARASFRFLCYSGSGEGHASGPFRIDNIFRKNPEVNAFFGCKPKAKSQAYNTCDLNGKTTVHY